MTAVAETSTAAETPAVAEPSPPGDGPAVVVVGGGHNGLVAGLRLARAGCRVTVLEQGVEPGGCVWTDRRPSGVVVERGAFEHAGIVATAEELGLTDPALGPAAVRYREHPVVAGFVFGDGERRVFHTDLERTVADLGDDGPAYRELVELAEVLFDVLATFDPPPTLTQVASVLAPARGGDDLFRTLLLPAEVLVARSITDRHTRTALELQAAHAQVPAWAPGTGMFGLLLPASHGGPSVRPEGGSRALIDALVAALEAAGGEVRAAAPVVGLATSADRPTPPPAPTPPVAGRSAAGARRRGPRAGVFGGAPGSRGTVPADVTGFVGTARGAVELADGTVLHADAVVSTLGLPRTAALLADDAPTLRAAGEGLHSGHFNVSELTVTVVLDRPVDLGTGDPDAVWYAVRDPDDVRRGFGEVLAGQLPSSPWSMVAQVAQPAEVTGGAVWMSSIVPLRRNDGPWTPELERAAAERVIDQVGEVLGIDLRPGIVDVVVSGPATWAERVGGDGNPNHLDNTIDQLLGWRAPGHADMRTELDWLFLSGAGQHPGGGLSGAAGTAAAAAVLTARGARRGVVDRVVAEARGLRKSLIAYLAMRRSS